MIFSNLSRPILLTNVPNSLLSIRECINNESFRRNLELINIDDPSFNINFIAEREIRGCILYSEDNSTQLVLSILKFVKQVPSIFLISEYKFVQDIPWIEICSPRYKKIAAKIDEYLTNIQRSDMNFNINSNYSGYTYHTFGNIYINPYKGLFIAVDYPDHTFGTELATRIHNFLGDNKIDNIYTNEPTSEISGSIAQMVKKGKMELFEDTLQLLYTTDRIEHARVLYKALQNGESIVSARYCMTTLAYAYKNMPTGFLLDSNSQVYWPDINIILFDPKERKDKDEAYNNVNKAFKKLGTTFDKTSYLLDLNEGLEKSTKKTLRIIRNHPKSKIYFSTD